LKKTQKPSTYLPMQSGFSSLISWNNSISILNENIVLIITLYSRRYLLSLDVRENGYGHVACIFVPLVNVIKNMFLSLEIIIQYS